MSERHTYAYLKKIPSRHAKDIRAQAIRGRMAVKGLYLPVQADWLSAFYREVLSFPAGKNDDLVDCLSLCGQVLHHLAPGRPLEPEKPRPKIISTDPNTCNVSLLDLFEANERKYKHSLYDRIR